MRTQCSVCITGVGASSVCWPPERFCLGGFRAAEVNPGCAQLAALCAGAPGLVSILMSRGVQAIVWIGSMIPGREVQSQLGFLLSHSKPVVESLRENSHLDSSAIQTRSVAGKIHLFLNSCGFVRVLLPQAGVGFAFWGRAEPNPRVPPRSQWSTSCSAGSCRKPCQMWICGRAEPPGAGEAPLGACAGREDRGCSEGWFKSKSVGSGACVHSGKWASANLLKTIQVKPLV